MLDLPLLGRAQAIDVALKTIIILSKEGIIVHSGRKDLDLCLAKLLLLLMVITLDLNKNDHLDFEVSIKELGHPCLMIIAIA